eukprot:CAMPEP_0119546708 /NCGR_PEP_ID=MMETSP1352-20130426/1009_1 /TAXON_ID=265584 /ORGANISM="Stauroneis constricta, Strain CCMP1120" /LENGTH=768 /DNA_ID=CAMNT_0007591433 /DNA_START=81 /DNA_END=2387 /DNA_ORIENTATION=+
MPDDKPTGNGAASAGKKKRNRKKKNKNKEQPSQAQQQQLQQQAEQQQADALNPLTIMRNGLIAQGFTGAQVDKAIDELWTANKAYDEHDTVLAHLKGGGDASAAKAEPAAQSANADSDAGAAASGSAKAAPAAAVASAATKEPTQAEAPAPVAATSKMATPVSNAPPNSIAARLDLVAGFESLADAAFALTEWVNKAAKTHELDEFCMGSKTKALPTVFCRAVTEDYDSATFESSILPAMSRLVFSILDKAGLTPEGVAAVKISMESCLKLARKLVVTTTPNDDFGVKLGTFLSSRIAVAVDEAKLAMAGGSGNIQRLQDDIDKIVKSLASNGAATTTNGNGASQSVDALVNVRDMNQTAAKKASMVARMAFSTLSSAAAAENGFSASTPNHLREVELTKSDILVALVGADGKDKIDQQRSEFNSLKAKVEATDSDDIKNMREELEGYQNEREIISGRIAELRLSIEKLEIYDAELVAKIADAQATLETDTLTRAAEMETLTAGMEEKQKAAKFGNSLTSLVDLLKGYDDSLDNAVQSATSPSKPVLDTTNESLGSIVSSKMSMFIFQVRNYLVAESNCVEGLKQRIEKTNADIADTKIEIAEMEGLGMSTTIAQMEQSIEKLQRRIADDMATIERATIDATNMFETLIARMEAYNLARAAEDLSAIDASCFQGIPSCIETLNIPNGERLNSIVEDGMLSLSPPKKQKPPMYGSGAVADIPPAPMPQMTAQAANVPKFTWAASKPAESSGKPSLLDIQKEELKSKEDA